MLASFDIWKVLAGIAIFMLGMRFLEEALHKLAGRPFKLFLRKHTSNTIKALGVGALITAILQSSSIVNLMILAFVGAGIIKMQNALAIILGANLGSTASSWIVATAGFQLNIENFALAVTGIAGILVVLINKEKRWYTWSKLLLGFGFLFVGLDFMKTGITAMVKQVDLGAYAHYPAIVFLLIGILITALIQSSAATMAIALSALHAGAIALLPAMAIALGAEIGTSLKLVLASIKGLAIKKRVALGNLLFNLFSSFLILLFLTPIHHFITRTLGIQNALIALVFFQSFINLAGIILFLPFLNRFASFLDKRFTASASDTAFIHEVNVSDTDLAMDALEKETSHFIYYVSAFALAAFGKSAPDLKELPANKDFTSKTLMGKYEFIKRLNGVMNEFCTRLRNGLTDQETAARLEQLVAVSRNTMYTAKSLKDTLPDIEQLQNSSNNVKYNFYQHTGRLVNDFYEQLLALLLTEKPGSGFEALTGIYKSIQETYTQSLQTLYKEAGTRQLDEIEFSTLINFNRETYTSLKSAIFAVKDFLLTSKEADYFDELPGFIR